MVMVVANPRLITSDRASWMNLPQQSDRRESRQHVVNGLPGYVRQDGSHSAENGFGVSVWMALHGLENGNPRTRHAQLGSTQRIRVVRGHAIRSTSFFGLSQVFCLGETQLYCWRPARAQFALPDRT